MHSALIDALRKVVGESHVRVDEASRRLYAQDVYTTSHPALAVISPSSTAELSACVGAAAAQGVAVVARGGGMSYTSGYVPQRAESILVDMGRMNRVVEINRDDMYVTVEAGCTWNALHEALKDSGLRTPFWGTLSGLHATVGGGVSQNGVFWGSGRHGTAVESVLALEVVLADGTVLRTGGAANPGSVPFMRNYGPDLTGLFLADTGAMGLKAQVTLRLLPELTERRYLTFAASDVDALFGFMAEVSRRQLASEVFGFDPYLQSQRMKRESLVKDVKALAGVMKSAGGLGRALKEGASVVMAGRNFLKDAGYSVHMIVEEAIAASADHAQAEIRRLATRFGVDEKENSIPKVLRANPFGPVNTMIGPNAERWVPVHGLLPHSRALETYRALEALVEQHRADVDRLGIGVGYLFTTVGAATQIIEPVFFWPDALNDLHRHAVERSVLDRLKEFPENLEARDKVAQLRREMIEVFDRHGAVHMQIGKAYPLQANLRPEAWQLLSQVKALLDARGTVNPGSLGLAAGSGP